MKVSNRKLSDVKPYWRNPRLNDAGVEAVAASIREFGMNQPIVVDADGVIIVGHTRYRALMQLGATSAPVVVADHLTPDQVTRYRIADNKTAEFAEWDDASLTAELREIEDIDSMQVFFGNEDLGALLDSPDDKAPAGAGGSPTAESISAAQQRNDTQFADRTEEQRQALIEVMCPHCAQPFMVNRNDIASRPAEAT